MCLGMRNSANQLFVIIENEAFPCGDDITMAVDRMFKMHFIFDMFYAVELNTFYVFLERYVYNIRLENTKVPTRAKELMFSIQALGDAEA